nr:T9SS type A sorting domain-containing protein [Salinivirgaceae bacterium]
AEDGTTTLTYEIVFNVNVLSTDASLSALNCDGGILVPEFNSEVLVYTVELTQGTTLTPVVTALATDINATVSVIDALDVTSSITSERTTTITVTAEDGITEKIYTLVFGVATGINRIENTSFTVYPNPSNGLFNIELGNTSFSNFNITILNSSGKVVYDKSILDRINYNGEIDVRNYPQGSYFILISNKNGGIVKTHIIY